MFNATVVFILTSLKQEKVQSPKEIQILNTHACLKYCSDDKGIYSLQYRRVTWYFGYVNEPNMMLISLGP